MQRYRISTVLNEGAFSTVHQAFTDTGDLVAIKRLKHSFRTWQECMELREVKALKRLSHPNVIKLREVIREGEELFFVFDHCERSLYTIMKGLAQPLRDEHIRLVMHQVFSALAYLHKSGLMHRDVKPENILCNGLGSVRLCDFALARELTAHPLTGYVSTRWYRAPELLCRAETYGSAVDMWAAGVVMVELFVMQPLFPGTSEVDMLSKVASVLGQIEDHWEEGVTMLRDAGVELKKSPVSPDYNNRANININDGQRQQQVSPHGTLPLLLSGVNPHAVDLVEQLLRWNPDQRISAEAALMHPFFEGPSAVVDSR